MGNITIQHNNIVQTPNGLYCYVDHENKLITPLLTKRQTGKFLKSKDIVFNHMSSTA